MDQTNRLTPKEKMAIYHASTKPIARSAGRSAVAAAAYRAGVELIDSRTGLVHDYTRKGGVVCTEIVTPDGVGAERNALWNAAEAAEKRKDARTAREWVVALPAELDGAQRRDLAISFGVELSRRYGVAVDVAIHRPDREGDNRNHHAHLLTTTRQVGRGEGGELVMGAKASLELSDTKRRALGLGSAADEVTAIRQLWERTANQALERAGSVERIDARSLAAQGIDREATTHLGPVASEMERRGVASDRGDGNRQVVANNTERQVLSAQIIDLHAERERRDRVRQAEAMPAADLVKAWDAERDRLAKTYRQRADRMEYRIENELRGIHDRRHGAVVSHDEQRPTEPQGLLATFKRASYEKALDTWNATMAGIRSWRLDRQATLESRLKRISGYLSRLHFGHGDKATIKAEKHLQRTRPELGERVAKVRAEALEQRRQAITQRFKEKMSRDRTTERGRGRGR